MFLLPLALSALMAFGATHLSILLCWRCGILDSPNSRSSHSRPMPRIGGVGILSGFYFSVAILLLTTRPNPSCCAALTQEFWVLLLAAAGMAGTGLYDDLRGLTPPSKFFLQLLWAISIFAFGIRLESFPIPLWGSVPLGVLSLPLTLLWLTAFANIYNFMDGIDGLAATTAVVYSLFFSLVAWREGNKLPAVVALLLGGSCVGFLFQNFPRARTFMGDTGSLFLGTFFACLVVKMAQKSPASGSLFALILICSVFLYDANFTIVRRILHRENIAKAHRSHLYQRLVGTGFTHGQVTMLYLFLHLCVGTLALAYLRSSEVWRLCVLVLVVLILAAFTGAVYWLESQVAHRALDGKGRPLGLWVEGGEKGRRS